MSSSPMIQRTASEPASRAASRLAADRSSPMIGTFVTTRVRANTDLMTSKSGSAAPSGETTMIELAASGLAIARSVGSMGSPLRTMTRDPRSRLTRGAQLVFHFDFVARAHDENGRPTAVTLRQLQFSDNRHDLAAPPQNDGVAGLEHTRAALAKLEQASVECARHDANEARHHDETRDRHHEHGDAEAPTLVFTERTSAQNANQRAPQNLVRLE